MPRKQHATRPPDDSPDTLPDHFSLTVHRIPGGWAVDYGDEAIAVGSGRFGLLTALTGALRALARGGR